MQNIFYTLNIVFILFSLLIFSSCSMGLVCPPPDMTVIMAKDIIRNYEVSAVKYTRRDTGNIEISDIIVEDDYFIDFYLANYFEYSYQSSNYEYTSYHYCWRLRKLEYSELGPLRRHYLWLNLFTPFTLFISGPVFNDYSDDTRTLIIPDQRDVTVWHYIPFWFIFKPLWHAKDKKYAQAVEFMRRYSASKTD